MSCAIAEPPTEVVGSADAVEIALRAERTAAAPSDGDSHYKGIARRHALHDAQMRLLSDCSNKARSADLKARIASAIRAKTDQHELADVQAAADRQATDLRKAGAEPEVCSTAQAEHDRLEVEWMTAWDVLRDRAGDVLDATIYHPDDLVVRHDAFLCLIGTEVEPIGTDDPTSEVLALTSVKDGLAQLSAATCRVSDASAGFFGLVETHDETFAVDTPAAAKAVTQMFAIEAFAAGVRAESMAGLGFRLATLGTLADEIEDCAASDNEERQERATKAVEAVRDIAGNAITLLNLPVDHRVAVYYLGERNLRGAA